MESREAWIRVRRTARYRILGDPSSAGEVWFVVHGYGQLAERFIRRFEGLPGLSGGERAVVAPESLSRFYVETERGPHGASSRVGGSWMTRSDREHEIADYVEYLDRLAVSVLGGAGGSGDASPARIPEGAIPTDGRRVVVLGFSQGAETASRWVTYGRIAPAELVLWGGGLAEDLDPDRAAESLAGVRVRLVVGDADRWARRRADWSATFLAGLGVPPDRVPYAGGHRVEPEVLAREWGDGSR